MKKLVIEKFDSIEQLVNTLSSRTNNSVMTDENSSESGSKDFTGTDSYSEAEKFIKYGCEENYTKIKQEIKINDKKLERKYLILNKKNTSINSKVGFIPNVPNLLSGHPDTMIDIKSNNKKERVMDIIYIMSESAKVNKEDILRAGAAMINALQVIEKTGIRIRLYGAFFCGECNNEIAFSCLKLKDYNQQFDLKKVAFPVSNSSMLRRFGFKWLETVPELEAGNWRWGYGIPVHNYKQIKSMCDDLHLEENLKILGSNEIATHLNCNVNKVLKKLTDE